MKQQRHFLLLIPILLLSVQGCDDANPVAPDSSALFITATPTQIALGGTSRIVVSGFKPDGNPLNPGTQIIFEATFGMVQPAIALIGSNGQATATFTSDGTLPPGGENGPATATVNASLVSGGGGGGGGGDDPGPTGGGTSSVSVNIQIGETSPMLLISAEPASIGLGQTSTIKVQARNADGSNFGAGGEVRLRTSLGSLDNETITTDAQGEAEATLQAGLQTGTAIVTATLGSSDEVMVEVTITESMVTITAAPSRINIEQESTISVIVRTADGAPLPDARVRLRTNLGQLDRQNPTTNANGEARATFRPTDRSGEAEITASIDGGTDIMTTVTILGTQVIVEANPATIDIRESATITVLALDADNIALVEGHEVQLTASLGTLNPEVVTTDGNGRGVVQYLAGDRAGTEEITAFLGNSTPGMTMIAIRDAPAIVSLDVSPTEFTPSTEGTDFMLTVRVSNAEGEPLLNELVRFEVSNGVGFTLDPPGGPSSDAAGRATATLTITASGVPQNLSSFTITALVRDVGSNVVPITIN